MKIYVYYERDYEWQEIRLVTTERDTAVVWVAEHQSEYGPVSEVETWENEKRVAFAIDGE
jgi:poly-gamma-glutamate capsule biosynthesis protein CapA/YwtB (metallophosphatase superfamily)